MRASFTIVSSPWPVIRLRQGVVHMGITSNTFYVHVEASNQESKPK